jgi:hypothetical protein
MYILVHFEICHQLPIVTEVILHHIRTVSQHGSNHSIAPKRVEGISWAVQGYSDREIRYEHRTAWIRAVRASNLPSLPADMGQ